MRRKTAQAAVFYTLRGIAETSPACDDEVEKRGSVEYAENKNRRALVNSPFDRLGVELRWVVCVETKARP